MKRSYSPYAVARLDGALLFRDTRAGFMKSGFVNLPIINFKIVAGKQSHPVWAFDDLAEEVFAYCQAAKESGVGETHLQVNLLGSWVSAEYFSIIIARNIEWHVASTALRTDAEHLYAGFKSGHKPAWPQHMLLLPVSASDLQHFGLSG